MILNIGGISGKKKSACLVKHKDLISCEDFQLVYEGDRSSYLMNQHKEIDRKNLNSKRKSSREFHLDPIYLNPAKPIAS